MAGDAISYESPKRILSKGPQWKDRKTLTQGKYQRSTNADLGHKLFDR